jgi:hypothetical protein
MRPEAIHRQALGIEGRSGRATDSFYRNAAATQPVQARSVGHDEDDGEVFWETVVGVNGIPEGRLLQQLVFEDSSGRRRAVPLNLKWTPDVLRAAIARRDLDGWIPTEVYVDVEDLPRALELLKAVAPGYSIQHYHRTGAGQKVRTLGFLNTVGIPYLRGVAKVGFHCALRLVRGLDGNAREFDVLRRFLRYGELPTRLPLTPRTGNLVTELALTLPVSRGGHLFLIEERAADLLVTSQLFASSSLPSPPMWQIRLGRKPPTLRSVAWTAYFAAYFDQSDPSGHDGWITRVERPKSPAASACAAEPVTPVARPPARSGDSSTGWYCEGSYGGILRLVATM